MGAKKIKKVGTINLDKKVILSDPCYPLGTWCTITLEGVTSGIYNCYVIESDEDDWGQRISNIMVVHKDYEEESKLIDKKLEKGTVGVDSGQAGIYDYNYYAKNNSNEDWYDKICNLTYYTEKNKDYVPVFETKEYKDALTKEMKRIFNFCDRFDLDKELIVSYVLKQKGDASYFIEKAIEGFKKEGKDISNISTTILEQKIEELKKEAYEKELSYIKSLSPNLQSKLREIRGDFSNKMFRMKDKYLKTTTAHEYVGKFDGQTLDDKCLVSSSGYGDGSYDCYTKEINGNIVYIEIEYI